MKTISTKRAERIARNINAMDTLYEYYDDMKAWRFWNNLKGKLRAILTSLSEADKDLIRSLCNEDKAKYFGLV